MNKQPIAAIFDVDGTLIAGASLEVRFVKYLWRYGELRVSDIARQAAGAFRIACAGQSIRRANKAYLCGKNLAHYRRLAADFFDQRIKNNLLPRAIERVQWHQQQGHSVALVSGSLDFLLEPLAQYLNAPIFIGTKIESDENILQGKIAGTQPYSKAKVTAFTALNQFRNFDLTRSFAYGNHFSDRHLLTIVGNPVATNPDRRLGNFARQKDWMIEEFAKKNIYLGAQASLPAGGARSKVATLHEG